MKMNSIAELYPDGSSQSDVAVSVFNSTVSLCHLLAAKVVPLETILTVFVKLQASPSWTQV
jgi:hypothetical protein